jgi:uncharacterized OB-fold protein
MSATVKTYTIIYVAAQELAPLPYAVVVADAEDGQRVAARADGDLTWLAVGARVLLCPHERYGMQCFPA